MLLSCTDDAKPLLRTEDVFKPYCGIKQAAVKGTCAYAWKGDAGADAAARAGKTGDRVGDNAVLNNIGSLWDEQQYAEDLSLDAFITKLKSVN